ncbi:MAG: rRNA maturation RNase YbeY [Spirochaetota bacterium]
MNHSNVDPDQPPGDSRGNRVHIIVADAIHPVVPAEELEDIALAVLQAEQAAGAEVSVLVDDDATVRELNVRFRGKNEPTDVLSFLSSESAGGDNRRNSGDIVISVSSVAANAERFGVSVDEELRRVLIHGMLHICGWNHATNDDDEPMLQRQEALLRSVSREHIR